MKSIKKLSITLALVLSIFTGTLVLTGCPKSDPNNTTLQTRVLRAALKFPEAVRILAPNADPAIFALLDDLRDAYKSVIDNPTRSAWEHANNIWNTKVRPRLIALNKTLLTAAILAFDLLLPEFTGANAELPGDAEFVPKFDKKQVEDFERKMEAIVGK